VTPGYELIDAREHGLDAGGLRDAARARGDAPFVCRSYRDPYALVAWFDRPVGVDLERIDPLQDGFAESICTPEERRALGDELSDPETVASLWSAKEALAKALGDALAYDPRRLESPLMWEDGEAGVWRALRLDVAPKGHVAWLCWRVS
jgi:hypothetical protein